MIDLDKPISPFFEILPKFKVDDIVSYKEKGSRLYCIHQVIPIDSNRLKIILRNKFGELFEITDTDKLKKHDNISSIEFDLDDNIDMHKKRLYHRAIQNIESIDNEIWKEVPGFKDLFVSDLGRVVSKSNKFKPYFLKKHKNKNNHLFISKKKDSNKYYWQYQVCWLVALTFIPNPMKYPYVHHLNDNKSDNSVANLGWTNNGFIEKTPYQDYLESKDESFISENSENNDFDAVEHYKDDDPWSLDWLDEETDGFWRWNID